MRATPGSGAGSNASVTTVTGPAEWRVSSKA
jgi:hypothetical protein